MPHRLKSAGFRPKHFYFTWNVGCTEESENTQPYQHLKLSATQETIWRIPNHKRETAKSNKIPQMPTCIWPLSLWGKKYDNSWPNGRTRYSFAGEGPGPGPVYPSSSLSSACPHLIRDLFLEKTTIFCWRVCPCDVCKFSEIILASLPLYFPTSRPLYQLSLLTVAIGSVFGWVLPKV